MNGKVCADCLLEMYPKKNGVRVVELAAFGPYKIWMADLWSCHGCHRNAILGFGPKPILEHWQEGLLNLLYEVRSKENCFEILEGGGVPK